MLMNLKYRVFQLLHFLFTAQFHLCAFKVSMPQGRVYKGHERKMIK